MSTYIIARFGNKNTARKAASLMTKLRSKVRVINNTKWEDVYLAEMINESMRDKGEMTEQEFSAWLKRKIGLLK